VLREPERPITMLPLLNAEERRRIIEDLNPKAASKSKTDVTEMFEAQVARTPGALALTFAQESLTFEELNQQANRLARYLMAHGAGPETLVAICMDRSAEM